MNLRKKKRKIDSFIYPVNMRISLYKNHKDIENNLAKIYEKIYL